MMEQAKQWWAGRSDRERFLLMVMAALAALVLAWLLVARPVSAMMTEAEPRLDAATRLHARAASAAAARETAPSKTGIASAPLSERLAAAASEAGFELVRNQASGIGVEIEIAAARGPALYAWLKLLDSQGIVVRTARLAPRSDGALGVTLVLDEAA